MATNANAAPFGITLRGLPLPVRLTLSLFLIAVGLGYFSALMQLHFRDASKGEPLPTPNDVVEIFSGVENWPLPKPAPAPAHVQAGSDDHGAGGRLAKRRQEHGQAPSSSSTRKTPRRPTAIPPTRPRCTGARKRTAGGGRVDPFARRAAEDRPTTTTSCRCRRRWPTSRCLTWTPTSQFMVHRSDPGPVLQLPRESGPDRAQAARRLLRLRRRAGRPASRPHQPADELGKPDADHAPAPAQLLHVVDADRRDFRVQQLLRSGSAASWRRWCCWRRWRTCAAGGWPGSKRRPLLRAGHHRARARSSASAWCCKSC